MSTSIRDAKGLWFALALSSLALSAGVAQETDPQLLIAQSEEAREELVKENMLIDAEEAKVFWPLYKEYRAALGPVHEQLVDITIRYADLYPHVSDEQATQLFDDYLATSDLEARIKKKYLRKFRKALRPKQAIRFAQIENKLNALVEFDAAVNVPLVN